MKQPKLKGCTERDLKERMKHYYPFVREIYRRLSATGIKGKLLAIGWNVFRDFVADTLEATDNKFKPEDCDRLFIVVNASQKKSGENNPDKQLCRSEFVEIMIRIAIKKFCENGELENEGDALDKLWKEYLHPHQQETNI